LLDGAVLAGHLLDDLLGPREIAEDPRLVALEPQALVARIEAGAHEAVRLRSERLDLALALDHHRQRRRLHPAERDDSADPGAAANGRGAGRVHPDQPVSLGARARRSLERLQLLAGAQLLEALADRLLRHRADPEPLHRLVDPGGLVDVGEDQLALAAGVARVDDP